ncbi:MAG: prephenate dehydratase domain-containing protein [Candidatus Eisenbacteria bacterium]
MSGIAYQGVPGAFSEEAAAGFARPGEPLLPCPSFEALFDAVATGRARAGAVPVENTLAGPVTASWDLLAERDVRVTGEGVVPVSHALVGVHGARFEDVRRVHSHAVALAQCERFFRAHPAIEPVAAADTAGAVEQVVRAGDPTQAALASARAAALYGGDVLARALEDHPSNRTRFFRIERTGTGDPGAGGKAALAFRTRHQPGALWRCLRPFAERGLSLTHVASRPLRHTPFEYRFFLEIAAPGAPGSLEAAIEELRVEVLELRDFGRFAPAPHPGTTGPSGTTGTGQG